MNHVLKLFTGIGFAYLMVYIWMWISPYTCWVAVRLPLLKSLVDCSLGADLYISPLLVMSFCFLVYMMGSALYGIGSIIEEEVFKQ